MVTLQRLHTRAQGRLPGGNRYAGLEHAGDQTGMVRQRVIVLNYVRHQLPALPAYPLANLVENYLLQRDGMETKDPSFISSIERQAVATDAKPLNCSQCIQKPLLLLHAFPAGHSGRCQRFET